MRKLTTPMTQKEKKNLKGFLANVVNVNDVEKVYNDLENYLFYTDQEVQIWLEECDEYQTILDRINPKLHKDIIKNKDKFNNNTKILRIMNKGELSYKLILLKNLDDYPFYLQVKLNLALGGNLVYILNPVEINNLVELFKTTKREDEIVRDLLAEKIVIVKDDGTSEGIAVNLAYIDEKEMLDEFLYEHLTDKQKEIYNKAEFSSYNVVELRNLETQQTVSFRLEDMCPAEHLLEDFYSELYNNESEADIVKQTNQILDKIEQAIEDYEPELPIEEEEIDPDFSFTPEEEEDDEEIDPGFSVFPEDDIDTDMEVRPRDEDGYYEPIMFVRNQMRFIITYLKSVGFSIYDIRDFMEGKLLVKSGIEYKIRLLDELEAAKRLYPQHEGLFEDYANMFEERPYLMIKPISSNRYVYNFIPTNYSDDREPIVLRKNFDDVFKEIMVLIEKEEERKAEEYLYEKYCISPR